MVSFGCTDVCFSLVFLFFSCFLFDFSDFLIYFWKIRSWQSCVVSFGCTDVRSVASWTPQQPLAHKHTGHILWWRANFFFFNIWAFFCTLTFHFFYRYFWNKNFLNSCPSEQWFGEVLFDFNYKIVSTTFPLNLVTSWTPQQPLAQINTGHILWWRAIFLLLQCLGIFFTLTFYLFCRYFWDKPS